MPTSAPQTERTKGTDLMIDQKISDKTDNLFYIEFVVSFLIIRDWNRIVYSLLHWLRPTLSFVLETKVERNRL